MRDACACTRVVHPWGTRTKRIGRGDSAASVSRRALRGERWRRPPLRWGRQLPAVAILRCERVRSVPRGCLGTRELGRIGSAGVNVVVERSFAKNWHLRDAGARSQARMGVTKETVKEGDGVTFPKVGDEVRF